MDENIIKVECYLDRIMYPKYCKKVENGEFAIFTVNISKILEHSCDENLNNIKLKGTVCSLEYGTTYKVYCKFLNHDDRYGDTYELIYINKCIDISNKDKQKEFLRNVLNKKLVDNLYEKYDDVISLLENKDIPALIKIRGIGTTTALKMIDEYEQCKDYSSIFIELGKLGLSFSLIKKLVDYYKSPDIVVDVVKNKPYNLMNVEGIGFRKADDIACKVGIQKFDVHRIKAFMIHYLTEQGELGKSYLNYQELISALYDNLGFVPEEVLNKTAKLLIDSGEVVVIDENVALSKYYNLEHAICNELLRLQQGLIQSCENGISIYNVPYFIDENNSIKYKDYMPKQFIVNNYDKIIKNVEIEQGFTFTDEQKNAIKLSMSSNILAITGMAGAGKSATAKGICALYSNRIITACALSGKASVRITEATGLTASTIHKTLGFQDGGFMYDETNKLTTDVVLIDEATMINGTLFLSLLKAIPTGAKVIIMGDVQQLTPIGNCQVFSDILDSNVISVVKLTKPHRQALESGIIPTSFKISRQEKIFDSKFNGINILGNLKDMELNVTTEKIPLSDLVVKYFQREIEKNNNILDTQICVAMKLRGDLSCYNINTKIQAIYNPKLSDTKEIKILLKKTKDECKTYNIRVRDKVLNTKNNYKTLNTNGQVTPIFNGNIGIVKNIDDDGFCIVDFDGIGEVVLSKENCKHLELAYACSTHKCQGSGFATTIVAIDNSSYIMNNSEWLYTAITRAKKYCILIGNNYAINNAISRKEIKNKQTFLKQFLMENETNKIN